MLGFSVCRGFVVVGLVLFVGSVASGCKGGDDPKVTAAGIADLDAVKREEADFLSRRDELAARRKKVLEERQALADKRRTASGDPAQVQAIEKEEQNLIARDTELAKDELNLLERYGDLLAKYEAAALPAGGGDDIVRRETQVASREKDFSRREQLIAAREAEIAQRERLLAQREKETCSVAPAAPAPIFVTAPTRGSKYDKRDVEPLLVKARRKMSEKGVLSSDLPSPATGLEREATAAMADGDFGKAKLAADQLLATVEAMKIDKAFVAAKIGRLNAAMKGATVAEATRKEIDEQFRAATGDYGDGKYPAANGKLNKIYSLLK